MSENGKNSVTIPVRLLRVGVGQDTVSVGFNFDRKALNLGRADQLLVGSRLQVWLGTDDPDQEQMFEEAAITPVESVADVHSMSVKQERLGGTLSFRRKELDGQLQQLTRFANADVVMRATKVGAAGQEASETEE